MSVMEKPVALVSCDAFVADETNEQVKISGLFNVVERVEREPSAYQWDAGFIVVRVKVWDGWDLVNADQDFREFFVNEWDLQEQYDPKGHAQMVRQEREAELAHECRTCSRPAEYQGGWCAGCEDTEPQSGRDLLDAKEIHALMQK